MGAGVKTGVAAGAAAAMAAGATMAGASANRAKAPSPLDLGQNSMNRGPQKDAMPSPTGTEYSFVSVVPGDGMMAAAGGTRGPKAAPVHRVQLDFKPSMQDELELKSGQLVRLDHEFDDGWVSLISLDNVNPE
jgi:hypothetical protein